MPSGVAKVLDEDAELGESLDQGRLNVARGLARAATLTVDRGEWSQQSWPTGLRAGLGLLLLDGLVLRRVELDGRSGGELLARGDVLRPWQREDAGVSVPRHHGWWVLQPCRVALLDLDFAKRIASYPELHAALLARTVRRSRYLAINMAIVHQPRVETRLRMLLWHLADRWGTVSPDGVLVPIRLTHSVLAELVAAQRPTVSAALNVLEREHQITRTSAGWTLHGAAPGELHASSPGR